MCRVWVDIAFQAISAPAAGKRCIRALKRLKDILDVLPGSMGEL